MRICIAVRALPVHRLGGLEYHTLDLATGLAARGHEVTIVTSRAPDLPDAQPPLPPGVSVVHLTTGRPGDYTAAFFSALGPEIRRLHAATPFDVIHAQEFAGLFIHPPPAPLVVTVHGTMFTEVPLDRRYFSRLSLRGKLRAAWRCKSRLVLHPFFRRMLRRAGHIIVDSEFTFRELLIMNPRLRPRLTIVPLGIDTARTAPSVAPPPSSEPRPLTIVLLGRLQEMKGVRVAIEAASLARARGHDFRMIIGGSGPEAASFQRLIDNSDLNGTVTLAGRIPEADAPAFLASGDAFLFPDKTQPAFGLVSVEAMACGLPVIGARSGAIPETVTPDVGWLYDAWRPSELASLIGRLADNPAEVRQKAAATRARASLFTSERMADATGEVYQRAAGTARP